MALLDITGGAAAQSNQTRSAVESDAQTAPLPDAFVSQSMSQKLDADYYAAADTYETHDSLSGSGNLNFATLQAQQNDLLDSLASGNGGHAQDLTLSTLASGLASGHPMLAAAGSSFSSLAAAASDAPAASAMGAAPAMAQAISATSGGNTLSALGQTFDGDIAGGANAINTTGGNNGNNGSSGTSGQNGLQGPAGPAGPAGQNGADGRNGTDGTNGTDGADGTGGGGHCCGPSNIDIDITVIGPVTIGPVITGPVITGPIIAGPIINGPLVDLGDVTQIVTNITNTVTTIVTTITDIIPDILTPPPAGSDTDLVVDLGIADLPLLNDTLHVGLDLVEQIIGNVDVNLGVGGILQGDTTTVTLGGELLGTVLPPIEIGLPVTVESLLTDPVGSVTDTLASLPETLQDITGGLTDLLAPPAAGDTDLLLDLGIADAPILGDALHVGLDAVEAVIGDVDINAGVEGLLQGNETTISLGGELLGTTLPDIDIELPVSVEGLLTDPVGSVTDTLASLPETLEGITGGLTDLLAPPASGDTDLLLDLSIADAPILGDALHVGLDAVEAVIGDVDINAGVEGLLQGNETTISLGGELLGTTLPDIDISVPTSVGDLLADPAGEVTEVIASLPDAVDGLLGALGDAADPAGLGDALDSLAGGGLLENNPLQTLGDLLPGDILPDGGGAWPETPVTAGLDAVVDGVLGDAGGGGILAPLGSVTEGLGLLDLGGGSGGGGGGGGGGGHHGGGLFGGGLGGLFG